MDYLVLYIKNKKTYQTTSNIELGCKWKGRVKLYEQLLKETNVLTERETEQSL